MFPEGKAAGGWAGGAAAAGRPVSRRTTLKMVRLEVDFAKNSTPSICASSRIFLCVAVSIRMGVPCVSLRPLSSRMS